MHYYLLFLALYKSMVHVMGLILSFRIMYSFVAGGHVIYGLCVDTCTQSRFYMGVKTL